MKIFLIILILFSSSIIAQEQDLTKLSEVEILRLQLSSLNIALVNCQIEVNHPGYKFDGKSLVKK